MKQLPRKSTAFISLVLVPMNLLGLGFTGCDSRDDEVITGADVAQTDTDFDTVDPDDVFNLDPVPPPANGPLTYPATQPIAQSAFAGQPSHHFTYSHSGMMFLPIPFRTGYQPPRYYSSRSSSFGSSGVSRSTSSGFHSSSSVHSSSTSHGGFGSTGHATASS